MSVAENIFDKYFESEPSVSPSSNLFDRYLAPSDNIKAEKSAHPDELPHYIRPKFKRAYEAAKARPSLLATELPVAGAQALEAPFQFPQFLAHIISQIKDSEGKPIGGPDMSKVPKFGDIRDKLPINNVPPVLPSEVLRDILRKNVPEGLQQGAQDIADIESFIVPFAKSAGGKLAKGIKKPYSKDFGLPSEYEYGFETQKGQFPSGLSKPRAVETENAHRGLLTKQQKIEALDKYTEEASNLTKKTLEEKLPFHKEVSEGVDFGPEFDQEFGEIKGAMRRFNPEIDSRPLQKFYRPFLEDVKGVPNPSESAKSIQNEIRKLRRQPISDGNSALNTFRENNRKRGELLKTGKANEPYYHFLSDYNDAIKESFQKTLPEDSAWLKKFNDYNYKYNKVENAKYTNEALKSVLGDEVTPDSLKKILKNDKLYKKLEGKAGKQVAQEIRQIAEDLDKAHQAIRRIPTKELTQIEGLFPLNFLLGGKIGVLTSLPKAYRFGKRRFGKILLDPEKRRVYTRTLKDIQKKDFSAAKKEAAELLPEPSHPSKES